MHGLKSKAYLASALERLMVRGLKRKPEPRRSSAEDNETGASPHVILLDIMLQPGSLLLHHKVCYPTVIVLGKGWRWLLTGSYHGKALNCQFDQITLAKGIDGCIMAGETAFD